MLGGASAGAVASLFAAALALGYSGLAPNDSGHYINAALRWVENGPSLGGSHWSLRTPIVAPMAASFALFGKSELTAALPNMAFAAGLLAATLVFASRILGRTAGLAAAALMATSAYFVTMQTEVSISGVEAFFIVLSCWIFLEAVTRAGDLRLFALSGAVAGAAWLCREVAILVPAAFTLFLLLRRPLQWTAIVAMGTAFAAVAAAELAVYAIVAGDPFYRLDIDLGHRGANPYDDGVAPNIGPARQLIRPLAFLLSATETTPFLVLGAAAFLDKSFRSTFAEGTRRDALRLFGLASFVAFVGAGYGLNLKSNDYYPIVAYASYLALGAYVAHLFERRGRLAGVSALIALFALNAASIDFRRYDEYAEARQLARYVRATDQTVMTDQSTAVRARTLLRLAGLSQRDASRRILSLREHRAPCGLIYAATPAGAARAIRPAAGWREIWRADPRRRPVTHRTLSALGLSAIPSRRLQEILRGAEPTVLYEAPPCAGSSPS
ncbi:MAG: glycosyltransferase family 39 protein [Parvularculaceae bacterium]|nr:glycosyltransferase family 39 protein [Parvularculaceae bacterium]